MQGGLSTTSITISADWSWMGLNEPMQMLRHIMFRQARGECQRLASQDGLSVAKDQGRILRALCTTRPFSRHTSMSLSTLSSESSGADDHDTSLCSCAAVNHLLTRGKPPCSCKRRGVRKQILEGGPLSTRQVHQTGDSFVGFDASQLFSNQSEVTIFVAVLRAFFVL